MISLSSQSIDLAELCVLIVNGIGGSTDRLIIKSADVLLILLLAADPFKRHSDSYIYLANIVFLILILFVAPELSELRNVIVQSLLAFLCPEY